MLRLTLREIRLILERLVQAHGAPPGLLIAVRDCAVASAVLPVSGFARLMETAAALGAPRPLAELADGAVDGAGQHAWYAAPALLDLAIERFRLTGQGSVHARNIAHAAELSVVVALAEAHGLAASAEWRDAETVIRIAPRPSAAPTLLDRIRHEGFMLEAAHWWPLYHASHAALAPDSFESRRHAGTVRVEADGRITGRGDEDETDFAMLTADPSRLRPASA